MMSSTMFFSSVGKHEGHSSVSNNFLFSASKLFSVSERLCPRRTRRQNIFRMMSSTTIFRAKFENRKDILLSQIIFRHHDHECNYIICIPALPISPSFSVPKYSCVPANRKTLEGPMTPEELHALNCRKCGALGSAI